VVFWQLEQWQRTGPLSVPLRVYWTDWQRHEPDIEVGEVILDVAVLIAQRWARENRPRQELMTSVINLASQVDLQVQFSHPF
jgi:hypothetical protein